MAINVPPIQPVDIRSPAPQERQPGVGTPIQRRVRSAFKESTSPVFNQPQQQQPNIAQLVSQAVGGGRGGGAARPRGGLQGLVGKAFPSGSLAQENPVMAALTVFKMVVDGAQGRGVDLQPLQFLARKREARKAAAMEGFKLGQTAVSTILSRMDGLDLPVGEQGNYLREQGQISEDELGKAGVDLDITTMTNAMADRLDAKASGNASALEAVHQINAVARNDGTRAAIYTACNGDAKCSLGMVNNKPFMDLMEKGIVDAHLDDAIDTLKLLRDMTNAELTAAQIPEELRAEIQSVLSRDFTQAEFAAVVRGLDMFSEDQKLAIGSGFASDRLEKLGITTPRVGPTNTARLLAEGSAFRRDAAEARAGGDDELADELERKANVSDARAAGFEAGKNPTAQLSPVIKGLLNITEDITNEEAEARGINNNPDPVLFRDLVKKTSAGKRVEELTSTLIDQLNEEGVDSFKAAGGNISRVLTSLIDQAKGVFQILTGPSGAAEDSEDEAYDNIWTRLDLAGDKNQLFRSRVFNLGFAIARSNDVGKLSDDDVVRALIEISANGFSTASGMIGALRDVARRTRQRLDDDIGALLQQRPGQLREPAPVRERDAAPPGIQDLPEEELQRQLDERRRGG